MRPPISVCEGENVPGYQVSDPYVYGSENVIYHATGFYASQSGYERGYGEEYIDRTSGATLEEVTREREEDTDRRRVPTPDSDEGEEPTPIETPDEISSRDIARRLIYRLTTELLVRTIQDTIVDIRERDRDDEGDCPVDSEEMEMFVKSEQVRTFESVQQTEFRGTSEGIDLQVDCPADSERWVRNVGGVGDADLSNLDKKERGDIAEQEAAPKFARDRGLIVPFVEGTGENGFDVVACEDNNGDGDCDRNTDTYHIIEAKFKSDDGSVGVGYLINPNKGQQMSDEWIENTIEEMIRSDDPEIRQLGYDLDNVCHQKELVVVQNAEQNTRTVTDSLNRPELQIDRVHIVKLEEVVG